MSATFGARSGIVLPVIIKVSERGARTATTRVRKDLKGVKNAAMDLRRSLGDLSYGFENLRQAVLPFAYGGVLAGVFAARELLKFNDALVRTEAAIGGVTAAERRNNKYLVRMTALTRTSNATILESAEAHQMLARSGAGDLATAREFLPEVLHLAAVDAKLSAEAAAEALLSLQKGFSLPADQASRVANVIARASDNIPGNVSDIVTAMRTLGPSAQAAGLEVEEALTFAVIARKFGLDPSRAGTATARFLAGLVDPVKAEKLNEIIGPYLQEDIVGVKGELADMPKLVGALEQAFNGLGKAEAAGILKNIFDQRGMRAAVKIITAGREEYEGLFKVLNEGWGAAEKSERVSKSLMSELKFIRTAIGDISVSFAEGLIPSGTAKRAGDFFGQVAEGFGLMMMGYDKHALEATGLTYEASEAAIGLSNAIDGVKTGFEDVVSILGIFIPGMGNSTRETAEATATFLVLTPVIAGVVFVITTLTKAVVGTSLVLFGLYRALTVVKVGMEGLAVRAALPWLLSWAPAWTAIKKAVMATWPAIDVLAIKTHAAAVGMSGLGKSMVGAGGGGGVKAAMAGLGSAVKSGAVVGLKSLWSIVKLLISPLGILVGVILHMSGAFGSATDKIAELRKELGRGRTGHQDFLDDTFGSGPGGEKIKNAYMRAMFGEDPTASGGLRLPFSLPHWTGLDIGGKSGGDVGTAEEAVMVAALSTMKLDPKIKPSAMKRSLMDAGLPENAATYVATHPLDALEPFSKLRLSMMASPAWSKLEGLKKRRGELQEKVGEISYDDSKGPAGATLRSLRRSYIKSISDIDRKIEDTATELAIRARAQGVSALRELIALGAQLEDEDVKRASDERDIRLDGDKVGKTVRRKNNDLDARAGAKTTPYQRHKATMDGADVTGNK